MNGTTTINTANIRAKSQPRHPQSQGGMRRELMRTCLLLSLLTLLSATGCHNKDSMVTRQVTWACPHLPASGHLPRMKDKEGFLTYGYKLSTAVRFHFVDQPDQYVDLYQPGLCQFLESQKTANLPMTIGLTRSPKGKLLTYEEVSLPGRDLSTSQRTRTSLYLASDKDVVLAMDNKTRLAKLDEFLDDEPIPARRMPVDSLLK